MRNLYWRERISLLYVIDAAASLCLCIKVGHEGNCITLHGIWSGNDISSNLFFRKRKLVVLLGVAISKGKEGASWAVIDLLLKKKKYRAETLLRGSERQGEISQEIQNQLMCWKGREGKQVTHRSSLRILSRWEKTMTEKSCIKRCHGQRTHNTKEIAIMEVNSVDNEHMQIYMEELIK